MTLVAGNAVFTVIFSQILAILFLGEKFIAKYDLAVIFLLPLATYIMTEANEKVVQSRDA